jgi:hypothetical protein
MIMLVRNRYMNGEAASSWMILSVMKVETVERVCILE